MAGLLDFLNSAEAQAGLGLLAAGGARSDGANFGQRMMEGLSQGERWKAQQQAAKRAEVQDQMAQMQMAQAQAQLQQQQSQMAQQQKIREGMGQFFKPGQQALSPLVGDPATGIMPSAGRAAMAPSFDATGAAQFLAQNGEYEKALSMMPKREQQINKLDVKDFSPASVAKFSQTGNYGDLVRMDKAHFANTGGKTMALDPFSGQQLSSVDNTQSPDSKASNQVAWANNSIAQQRLGMDRAAQAKPQFHDGQWVMPPTFANPQGTATPIPGFQKPLGETAKKTLSGIESLNGAIGEYLGDLKSWGATDALRPDKRASMGTKYNNMMLQAKEAYNLGVLNGPDLEILQSVVTDPRSMTGAITSNAALAKQASELSRIMSKTTAPAVRGSGASAERLPSKRQPCAGTHKPSHLKWLTKCPNTSKSTDRPSSFPTGWRRATSRARSRKTSCPSSQPRRKPRLDKISNKALAMCWPV